MAFVSLDLPRQLWVNLMATSTSGVAEAAGPVERRSSVFDDVFADALEGLPLDPRRWSWGDVERWLQQLGDWTPLAELRAQRERGDASIKLSGADLLLFDGSDDSLDTWCMKSKQDRVRFKAAVQQVKVQAKQRTLQVADTVLRRLTASAAALPNKSLPTNLAHFLPEHVYLWLRRPSSEARGISGIFRDSLLSLEMRGPFLVKMCLRAQSNELLDVSRKFAVEVFRKQVSETAHLPSHPCALTREAGVNRCAYLCAVLVSATRGGGQVCRCCQRDRSAV